MSLPVNDDTMIATNVDDNAISQFAKHVQRRGRPDGIDHPPLLVCKDFSVLYNDIPAVNKLCVEIPRAEVTAIIGPSGCGKSTFLNAINRMTDLIPGCSTQGSMHLDGKEVYGPETDVVWLRRRIGMVFQKPNPFPKSILANVAYGPKLHGMATTRSELMEIVQRSLEEAALWDEVKDRLHTNALGLSGGQQQRLCIARALAVDPDVILFDEPTSALDPGSTSKVEELMSGLRGSYTVVIVTHNLQQASRISDYTMFLYKGDLIEFGRTADLFIKPQQERTERYITGSFG
jgi:phosphate transport system ATP-binding protein